MHDRVLTASDLVPFLAPNVAAGGGSPAAAQPSLAVALAAFERSSDLHARLEEAFAHYGSRLVDVDTGRAIATRVRELRDAASEQPGHPSAPRSFLPISLSVSITNISIPDSSRDELLLTLRLTSGAELDKLIGFLVDKQLLSPAEATEAERRWRSSDSTIGSTDAEFRALERVLGITPVGATGEANRIITYNYGTESGCLWRTYDGTITIQVSPELRRYPLDEACFRLSLRGVSLDPSESALVADDEAPIPVSKGLTSPPRGFDIVEDRCSPLQALCISPSPEDLLESEVRFYIALRRQPGSFVWRVLTPAYLILLMGFVSTYFGLVFPLDSRTGVMTQLIPALFITAVALQWTAAQQLPSRSGATRMDRFFVVMYATLLLLYVSLEVQRFAWHWPLYGAAAFLVVAASWTWRDLRRRA